MTAVSAPGSTVFYLKEDDEEQEEPPYGVGFKCGKAAPRWGLGGQQQQKWGTNKAPQTILP